MKIIISKIRYLLTFLAVFFGISALAVEQPIEWNAELEDVTSSSAVLKVRGMIADLWIRYAFAGA